MEEPVLYLYWVGLDGTWGYQKLPSRSGLSDSSLLTRDNSEQLFINYVRLYRDRVVN